MRLSDLEYAKQQFGTPLYVFNMDEIGATVAAFRKHLADAADICFAIKANPFLVSDMSPLVDRIEVCSTGEFRICKAKGIPAEKILISGVLKKEEDIREIMDTYRGKCQYTAESLHQYEQLRLWARENKETIRVFLRLSNGSQFGMDESVLQDIVSHWQEDPYVVFAGIHYFTGTQKKNIGKIEQELAFLDTYLEELEEKTGYVPEELEYGPGIAVPYFVNQKDNRVEELKGLAAAVASMRFRGKVTLEMGRALAAQGGYYLTTVCDVKQNKGKNYCIVDGGIHQINYDGQIRGMYNPIYQVFPQVDAPEEEWTVCGALCTTNDILMQKMLAGGLKTGSTIVFERTGAYAMTEGMATFLSHPLPVITLYSEKRGWQLLREREETYLLNM